MSNMPLIAKPVPYSDESPGGVILRASQRNGWESPNEMIKAYISKMSPKIQLASLFLNKGNFEALCVELGIDLNGSDIHYQRGSVSERAPVTFMGHQVPYKMLRSSPAICPRCIDEDGYIKAIWDHKLITGCSKHQIYLVQQCPDCNEELDWNRGALNACQCGYELNSDDTPCTGTEMVATRLLEDVLVDPNKADKLELVGEFVNALSVFYQEAIHANISHHLCSSAALGVYSPERLAKQIVKQIIHGGTSIHPRILLSPLLASKAVEVRSIALDALKTLQRGKCSILGSQAVTEAILTLPLVAAALGIPESLTSLLIKSGILDATKKLERSPWEISLRSVQSLLLQVERACSPMRKSVFVKVHEGSSDTKTFTSIISDILNGAMIVNGYSLMSGLAELEVDREQKLMYQVSGNRVKYDVVGLIEAAEICHSNKFNIRDAMKAGLLTQFDPSLTRGTEVFIDRKAVIEFNEAYAFSGTIAEQVDARLSDFSEKLMKSGAVPVSGPCIDGAITYAFKRTDIEQLDLYEVKALEDFYRVTGRKIEKKILDREDSISVPDVAAILDMTYAQVMLLVDAEELTLVDRGQHRKIINHNSLTKFLEVGGQSKKLAA